MAWARSLSEKSLKKDFSVEVEVDDNLLPFIKTESDGETLRIETTENFSTRSPIRLRISAPDVGTSGMGQLKWTMGFRD